MPSGAARVPRNEPAMGVREGSDTVNIHAPDAAEDDQWSTMSEVGALCDTVRDVLRILVARASQMSAFAFCKILFVVLLLLCGGAMQVIFLNYWLSAFPSGVPGNYTILTVSALLFSAFFLVLLMTYVVTCRPRLAFVMQRRSLGMLCLIGFADAANSALAIYAASHTSEVLQAIFLSLVPVYATVFTKLFLKDKRRYANPFVVVGFSLLIAGICLASFYVFVENEDATAASSSHEDHDSDGAVSKKVWVLLFFLSVPLTVLMNVGQTVYMLCFTEDDAADRANLVFVEDIIDGVSGDSQADDAAHTGDAYAEANDGRRGGASTSARAAFSSGSDARAPGRAPNGLWLGDDIAVKLVMLAGGTTIQALICLVWMPMDALPWYGGSDSVAEAWTNFAKGVNCLVHCPNNLLYGALYSAGFVFVYIGAAYLNQYSVTLCAMVSQMSGPVTALLLIAFPALNVTGDTAPWYVSLAAVCLLVTGTFVYVVWDEKTAAEKEAGELELKMKMHGTSRSYQRLEVDP